MKHRSNKARIVHLKNTYTGTHPMMYHETGSPEKRTLKGAENYLPDLVDHILSLPEKNLGCPLNLTIVTWNNYPEESILERTTRHLGIPIKVYGKHIQNWTTNYEYKLKLMYESCCNETTEYIMGVDSRDLVFLTSPENILREFLKMDIKMLFGGTIKTSNFYNDAKDLVNFLNTLPKAKDKLFRNLNGGQWIADRLYAKSFFEKALGYPPRAEKPESDQIILTHTLCYSPEFNKETKIDYTCKIFQIYTTVIPLIFFYRNNGSIMHTVYLKIKSRFIYAKYHFDRSNFKKDIKLNVSNIKNGIKSTKKKVRKFIKKALK